MQAMDSGVGNQGVSVPIRGPHGEFSLFSLSHTCSDEEWSKFLSHWMSNLLLIGHYLHSAVRVLENMDEITEYVSLSPRETDALRLLGAAMNRGVRQSSSRFRNTLCASTSKARALNWVQKTPLMRLPRQWRKV